MMYVFQIAARLGTIFTKSVKLLVGMFPWTALNVFHNVQLAKKENLVVVSAIPIMTTS